MEIHRTEKSFSLFPLVGINYKKGDRSLGLGWLFWLWVFEFNNQH